MFREREILERLASLEAKIDRIERAVAENGGGNEDLRAALDRKRDQYEALSAQSLRIVELLNEARQEIERLRYGGGS